MYRRPLYGLLKSRLEEPRRFIQVLVGPRQVGKTTLLGQLLEEAQMPYHSVSADDIGATGRVWLEQQWEIARLKCRMQSAASFLFVIDEVQKLPQWSEAVKACWDADTRADIPIKLLLSGSSGLLLQQGLTESLMGRFEVIYAPHWSFSEMEAAFGVSAEQYAWFGGYPGAAALMSEEARWKRYVLDALVEPSIARDVLSLTRVDKPALLRRLFELGCQYSAQALSYNKMLGQLTDAGNTTTLAHYLKLLDAAGLLAGLEKYHGSTVQQRKSSPKFQVYNTALLSAQWPEFLAEALLSPERWGRVVESAIGAHLLNYARQSGARLYYWREGDEEVDFVLEQRGRTIALEVKSGRMRSTSGMAAFQRHFAPQRIYLVGKEGLPWAELLRLSPEVLF